jgi:Tfp pilus assembly protein PilV
MRLGFIRKIPAFSLVEVVLAIGILSFAIIGVISLVSVGLQAARDAVEKTEATHMASLLLANCAVPPPVLTQQPLFPALSGTSRGVVENTLFVDRYGSATGAAAGAAYRVEYRIHQVVAPTAEPSTVWLRLSWPAPAPRESARFLEVVTALPVSL